MATHSKSPSLTASPADLGEPIPPPGLSPRIPIQATDLFSISQQSSLAVSPGGKGTAYIESRWAGSERRHALCVISASAAAEVLHESALPLFAPQWGSDGKRLFVAKQIDTDRPQQPGRPHQARSQVWRIKPDGQGEPVTDVDGGIARFEYSAAADGLFFTTHQEHLASHSTGNQTPFSVAQNPILRSQLWRMDLESRTVERIHSYEGFISSFAISPDANTAALVTAPDETLISNEGQATLEFIDLRTGVATPVPSAAWKTSATSPFAWLSAPSWSPDGDRVAMLLTSDAQPSEILIVDTKAAAPSAHTLPRPQECNPLRLCWRNDGHLLFSAELRAAIPLLAADPDRPEEAELLTPGDVAVTAFSASPGSSSLAILEATPDQLPQIRMLSGASNTDPLSDFNAHAKSFAFPTTSRMAWQSTDGTEVEGILALPPGYRPGSGALPTIINLHGGPGSASLIAREFNAKGKTALACAGYAVLHPNFRGSTGYGDRFQRALIGRTNDIEIADILAGVDALVGRGIADPHRLGVMGWSYGGYLVNCLLASGRFKAASTGAGAVDMFMQFAEMDTPGHTVSLLDAYPWEQPEEYRRSSPIYGLGDGVETATLIHSGGCDERVPPTHARALHRTLSRYLNAPCELLVYPGTGHQLTSREHLLTKLTADLDWFGRYL